MVVARRVLVDVGATLPDCDWAGCCSDADWLRRRVVPLVNGLAVASAGSGRSTLPVVGLARDDFRVALLGMGSSLAVRVAAAGLAFGAVRATAAFLLLAFVVRACLVVVCAAIQRNDKNENY